MQNPFKSATPFTRAGVSGAVLLLVLAAFLSACRGGGANPNPDASPLVIVPTPSSSSCIQHLQPAEAPQFSGIDQSKYITTESGLKYYDVTVGTGETPTFEDAAVMEYTGWRTDGCMFDTSYLNEGPVTRPLISMLRGWFEAISTMKEGGVRVIELNPNLAFGTVGRPPLIGQDTVLIYHIHLIDRLTIEQAQATVEAQQATATVEAQNRNATATAAAEETAAAGGTPGAEGTPGAGETPAVEGTPAAGETPEPTSAPSPAAGQ